MKYDFTLDTSPTTSTGKILAEIQKGSRVLEFGPGNGRMTRFLTESLDCDVTIIEFDPELFQAVKPYAAQALLENIETLQWKECLQGQMFDVCIFADVLEHLRNPKDVLAAVRDLLTPEGKVCITFPNIAHNSVLIDLFNNRLTWQEYGLLDHTHVSYETEAGFHQWFSDQGWYIAVQDYTYAKVGENELGARYEDLPESVRYGFQHRPFGEVYQYFFVLQKTPPTSSVIHVPENSYNVHECHVIYETSEGTHTEVILSNEVTGENHTFTLNVPHDVRFVKWFPLLQKTDAVLSFSVALNDEPLGRIKHNAAFVDEGVYLFQQDVQACFEWMPPPNFSGGALKTTLDYQYIGAFMPWTRQLIQARNALDHKLSQQAETFDQQQEVLLDDRKRQLTRYTELVTNPVWQKHKKAARLPNTSPALLNAQWKIRIESMEFDRLKDKVYIRGWGMDLAECAPLEVALFVGDGFDYKVTPQYRPDVSDEYDLSKDTDYGFLIEIDTKIALEDVQLIFTDVDQKQAVMTVSRSNLTQASRFARLRYLLGMARQKGFKGTLQWYRTRQEIKDQYAEWLKQEEDYLKKEALLVPEKLKALSDQPLISIVVPVYNVDEVWLKACVASLKAQWYPNWELCLSDDASPKAHVAPLLEALAKDDERIKVVFRATNGHISKATNSAIQMASGDYIGFMDNDDVLAPQALYRIVQALNRDTSIDFIYTDEDKCTTRNVRFDPFFKPNWNETLLLGHNYITHFVVVKKTLLDQVGMLRSEYDGSQDYDFVLRATEQATRIYHIPELLYHWRTVETSVASDPKSKLYAYEAGQRALEAALARRGIPARVKQSENFGCYEIDYLLEKTPKVTVVWTEVAGIDQEMMQEAQDVLLKTHYSNWELLVPENYASWVNSALPVRVYDPEQLKDVLENTQSEYVAFLAMCYVPEDPEWLTRWLNEAVKEETGCVGAAVISPEAIVYHAGFSFDPKKEVMISEARGASFKGLGYYFRLSLPREVYAVSELAYLMRLSDYLALEERELPEGAKGVDTSLQVRYNLHKKVIWNPYVVVTDLLSRHFEGSEMQTEALRTFWEKEALYDPYRNPNSLEEGPYDVCD